jgi:hypothetical protein
MVEIIPNLYLGDVARLRNKDYVEAGKFDVIIDCNYYYRSPKNPIKRYQKDGFFLNIIVKSYPIEDNHFQNPFKYYDSIYNDTEIALSNNKRVYIHCEKGISRSATIVIAYLMKKNKWNLENALNYVKTKKPNIAPNTSFVKYLQIFEQDLYHTDYVM